MRVAFNSCGRTHISCSLQNSRRQSPKRLTQLKNAHAGDLERYHVEAAQTCDGASAVDTTVAKAEAWPPGVAKHSATTGDGEALPPEFAQYSADSEARPPGFAKYMATVKSELASGTSGAVVSTVVKPVDETPLL